MISTLSSELVRSALDSSPDAMVLVDAKGLIVFANQQLSALFGYTRDQVRGQSIELLIPERFRGRHPGHRATFAAEHRVRPMGVGLELFARRQDGSEFPVEISLSPINDTAAGGALVAAAIRDVTERKRVQQELIQAREAAERERQIADAARETADRANQAKSRFLATASHDLRQPLQSLALLNGTLRRLVDHPDALEALTYQDQAIEAMSRLLNALLDISKLESGAIRPAPVDFTVTSLFKELEQEYTAVAANKGLQLHVSATPKSVHSDPALVGQILRNLLSNAVKYTRAGSVRLVSLSSPGAVRIEVIDTGIGIPADQLQFIYDEFFQVGVPTNSSRDGYGLGLSIVHRLVRLLQLKLEVRSEVGQGSVFALELPQGRASTVASTARATLAQSARQASAPQLLLVEDDPAVRDATRMLLKVEGYRVLTAGSLAEARSAAQQNPQLDLLVTDYHLSNGETGAQVITALREELGQHLKAVLITGDTSSAMKELQRDERLRLARKPIRAEELLALLKSLLAP
ncbi:MAG TPA: PAS domain S-box protein [Steroidobacteraceae bacterium]|nr:PAS domain S-box protein [Steroidobacteraceae bacterium]